MSVYLQQRVAYHLKKKKTFDKNGAKIDYFTNNLSSYSVRKKKFMFIIKNKTRRKLCCVEDFTSVVKITAKHYVRHNMLVAFFYLSVIITIPEYNYYSRAANHC